MRLFRTFCSAAVRLNGVKPKTVKLHLRKLYGIDSSPTKSEQTAPKSHPSAEFNADSATDVLDYLRKTKSLIAQTVSELDELSPKSIEPSSLDYPTFSKRRYSWDEKLPAFPAVWTRDSLRRYLEELTSKHYSGTERLNDNIGLVPHVVCDLLRPNNRATHQCLSVEAYNAGIRYFLGIKDIESAQKLLENMSGSFLEPNTDTFNYFLWPLATNVAANPYRRDKGHPLEMVLQILHQMRRLDIKANTETWNLALQAMPMGFGKSFLVEEMSRRNIPLNERSLAVCTATIAEKAGCEAAVDWALGSRESLPVGVLNLLLSLELRTKRPDNNNVVQALNLLDTVSSRHYVKPTVHTLNVFLSSFAGRRRLDWQLGVLRLFAETHGVTPSPLSVQHLLEAAMGQAESSKKYATVGMVLARYREMPTTPRTRTLIRRAVRRAEKRGYALTDPGRKLWVEVCQRAMPVDGVLQSVDIAGCIGDVGAPIEVPACEPLPRTDSAEYADKMAESMNWNYQAFQNYVNKRAA